IVAICANSGCAIKVGKQPRQEMESLYSARSPEFRQSAGSLLGPNFVGGNSVSTLVNGDEIFPALLRSLAAQALPIFGGATPIPQSTGATIITRSWDPLWPSFRRAS